MTTESTEAVPVEWTIVSSETEETSAGPELILVKESADGERDFHSMPLETLEWRAAEYDIDPNDFDALLDVVLHEGYVDDPGDPANVLTDAAAAAGYVSPAVELRAAVAPLELMPTTLLSAETPELARGAQLERIAHVKKTRARVSRASGKKDPCRAVKKAYAAFVGEAEVEAKRQAVTAKRQQMQASAQQRAERGETGARRRRRLDRRIILEGQSQ